MPPESFIFPNPVPYYAQIATPEMAIALFEQGIPFEQDPGWREYGASSPEEYAYWADRACGIACVKMVVEALGGPCKTMMDWIHAGLALNGYLIRENSQTGTREEIGWVHRALAALIESGCGAHAVPQSAGESEILGHVRARRLVIASVSYEIGTLLPVSHRGGHLAVITGAELEQGVLNAWRVHNPSGRSRDLREHARVPVDRFRAGYAGRMIAVHPKN